MIRMIKLFKCPNCKEPTISLWKKINVTYENRIECKNCGSEIGLSRRGSYMSRGLLYVVLALIVFFAPRFADNNIQLLLCDLFLAGVFILIESFAIPLTENK
jgi:hypothetical protein